MKAIKYKSVTTRTISLLFLSVVLFVAWSSPLAADLPAPWSSVSGLSDQQRAQITQIIAIRKNQLEKDKAIVIQSRMAYHQNLGTLSLATNDIIQWTHQTVRLNSLLERREIMEVLSPQQQREADNLWQKIDRTVAAENFKPFEVRQKNARWCWAASISVILNYGGIAWDQERVAQEIKGTSDSWKNANATEIADGLNRMKTSSDPRKSWTAICKHVHGTPEVPRMIMALEFGRPMLAALNNLHVVVVHKVIFREDTSSGQREIQSIEFFDPLKQKNESLTWKEAAETLTDVWYPIVSPSPNNWFSRPTFPGDRF